MWQVPDLFLASGKPLLSLPQLGNGKSFTFYCRDLAWTEAFSRSLQCQVQSHLHTAIATKLCAALEEMC